MKRFIHKTFWRFLKETFLIISIFLPKIHNIHCCLPIFLFLSLPVYLDDSHNSQGSLSGEGELNIKKNILSNNKLH